MSGGCSLAAGRLLDAAMLLASELVANAVTATQVMAQASPWPGRPSSCRCAAPGPA